jgi:hypothetical protein
MAWAAPKAPKGDRGYGYQYQKLRKALLPAPTAHRVCAAGCRCCQARNSTSIMTIGTAPYFEASPMPNATSGQRHAKHGPNRSQPSQGPANRAPLVSAFFLRRKLDHPRVPCFRIHPIPIVDAAHEEKPRFFVRRKLDHPLEIRFPLTAI